MLGDMKNELLDIWEAVSSSRPINESLNMDRFLRLLDQGLDIKNADVIAALCRQGNLQESARERTVKKLIIKGRKVELNSLFNIYNLPKVTRNHLITMTDILVNSGGLDLHASYLGYEMNVLHSVCERYIGPDLTVRIQLLTSRFGISINSQSQTGCNALHFLFRGSFSKIDYRDNQKLTECCNSLLEAVTFLVNNGIDVKCEDNQGRNPLFYFYKIQDYEPVLFSTIKGFRTQIMDILLQKEPGIIYFIDKDGKTILHAYCKESFQKNFVDYLQLLIDKGISINALDNRGFNALHCLFQNNRLQTTEVVKSATIVLLNNGINAKLEDEVGRNPLFHLYDNYSNYLVPEQVCGEITDLLIQRGVDINVTDKDGINILLSLCSRCKYFNETRLVPTIDVLIKKGINVNAFDKKGFNSLHQLFQNIYLPYDELKRAVTVLLENGIEANLEDEAGRNPLFHLYDSCSQFYGLIDNYLMYVEITDLLIQRGLDINATDKDGINILHFICDKHTSSSTCLVEMIGLLIKKGININALTKKGFNALHFLCNRDWFFVTQYTEQLFGSAKLLIGNGILDFDFGPSTTLRESFFYLFSYFTAHKFNIDQVDFTSFKSYVNDFRTEPQSNIA